MPDRDLALDAKLSLALGWKRIDQHLWVSPSSGRPCCFPPALSTDPAQVVERMSAEGWTLTACTFPQGETDAAFTKPEGLYQEYHQRASAPSFSLAIAKAALSALEAERESQNQQEGA